METPESQVTNNRNKPFDTVPCDCSVCEKWRSQNFYSERSRLNALSHHTILDKVVTNLEKSLDRDDAVKFPLPKF